jgi:hypothetical protein
MNSYQRVQCALQHQQPDHVPLDLGASAVTGMHVSSVRHLRQALGLDGPGTPVKVVEPYQMLGEIAPDLADALGVDVVGLGSPKTMFGFENKDWKPWTLFDGTPVLVPAGFNTEPQSNGDILMYPEGDRSFARSRLTTRNSSPKTISKSSARLATRRSSTSRPKPSGSAATRGGPCWRISAVRRSATSRWCRPPS